MSCSQGFASQLSINGQAMEFISLEGGQTTELIDNGEMAIRGILDRVKERVTQGLKRIALRVVMQPSPSELDELLPLIGLVEGTTDVYTVTDDFSSLDFDVIVDRVQHVHTYANCRVNSAVFRGSVGNPISLELEIFGTTAEAEGAAGSFSATAIDLDHNYAFHEATINLESSARSMDRFALSINNNLFPSFNNSQVAESLCPTDRVITFAVSSPYDADDNDLYTSGIADAGGAAGTLAWSRGGKSTSFAMANLKLIGQSPPIPNKRAEIRHNQFYRCYRSGSTAALVCTHDNTA